ncbi:hypothetical protein IEQ34_004481 [Dendrobium chrysotoxum]|uniref:Uncharacterized protein n=1 Tax=Dendrobium chrysotoxum TaxID=161865 RepID=A0AAV7HIC0_DENCH|nr:hypothetical protein IEQ34_004481 [Dendrobium chrysotoxum]
MDHIPLQLRSFKLHIVISKNLIANDLPPKTNATLLEINGVKIPPNKQTPIVLCRIPSIEAASETEVVYASMDQIFICDGLCFEVNFVGEKPLKRIFQREMRWGVNCELIGLDM